jgi:hypothetical protein
MKALDGKMGRQERCGGRFLEVQDTEEAEQGKLEIDLL